MYSVMIYCSYYVHTEMSQIRDVKLIPQRAEWLEVFAIKSSSKSILSSQPCRDVNYGMLAAALPLLLMEDKV